VLDPVRVGFETQADGSKKSKPLGFLLRSALVPARFGTPLDAVLTVTATGTVRAPSGAVSNFSGAVTLEAVASEPRTVIDGYDQDGLPLVMPRG
jgi:hypothetical protein